MTIEQLYQETTISIERRHSMVKKLLYSIDKIFLSSIFIELWQQMVFNYH